MDPASFERSGSWLTFLRNHREAIGAMNFFIVPTLTFGVLYFFFVISHDRDLSTTAGTRNWRQVSRNAAASASHDGLSKATQETNTFRPAGVGRSLSSVFRYDRIVDLEHR